MAAVEMRNDALQEDFFPIHLAVMQPGTVAPVNLYMKAGDPPHFILYRAAQTPMTEETRQRLLDRGLEELHLHQKDGDAYNEYVEQNLIAIVRDELLPRQQACQVVYDSSSRVMREFFADPHSGKNFQRASVMVRVVVVTIMQSSGALWDITTLASHDYATYTHSVHVCAMLVGASKELLDTKDATMLERIGFGAMLHDLGKSQIPEEVLRKPDKLTDQEFEMVKQHPLVGLEIVERHRKVSDTAAAIIRSHHERYDGKGYPDGLTGERTRPVARLAKIVDVYDALTTERPYAPARAPYDALDVMLRMKGHFDVPLLDSFVRFLGPNSGQA